MSEPKSKAELDKLIEAQMKAQEQAHAEAVRNMPANNGQYIIRQPTQEEYRRSYEIGKASKKLYPVEGE